VDPQGRGLFLKIGISGVGRSFGKILQELMVDFVDGRRPISMRNSY